MAGSTKRGFKLLILVAEVEVLNVDCVGIVALEGWVGSRSKYGVGPILTRRPWSLSLCLDLFPDDPTTCR